MSRAVDIDAVHHRPAARRRPGGGGNGRPRPHRAVGRAAPALPHRAASRRDAVDRRRQREAGGRHQGRPAGGLVPRRRLRSAAAPGRTRRPARRSRPRYLATLGVDEAISRRGAPPRPPDRRTRPGARRPQRLPARRRRPGRSWPPRNPCTTRTRRPCGGSTGTCPTRCTGSAAPACCPACWPCPRCTGPCPPGPSGRRPRTRICVASSRCTPRD